MNGIVSVIVAAYRAQPTLQAAVASVLAQDMDDWELIVVADDGVDYRDHVSPAVLGDHRMRFIRSGGLATGPAAARNAGLAVARGGFVAALDADDRMAPDRLKVLRGVAAAAGVAADCVDVVDIAGRTLRHAFPPGGPDRDVSAAEIMSCGVPLHPVVRRDMAGEGWPALRFAEDVVFNLEVIARAGRFPVVMRPLYSYVVHGDSICHRPDAAAVADAAYEAIVAGLEGDAYRLTPTLRAEALAGFRAKRAVNRAFALAQAEGRAATFQEFLALEHGAEGCKPAPQAIE